MPEEVLQSKVTDNIAQSRRFLNTLAKRSVEDKNFHVVLTLTKSVGFVKEKPSVLPTVPYGQDLQFPRKFLRPDKQYLAIKKVEATRKSLEERTKEMRLYARKAKAEAKKLIQEGHGPIVCNHEYTVERFNELFKLGYEGLKKEPLAPVHPYVAQKAVALIPTAKEKEERQQDLIKRAFHQFTEAELKKIRNFKIWFKNEQLRLEARAEFYNRQVDYWKQKKALESNSLSKHKTKVRRYKGLYGEPYFYNRRDVYIPKHAFCNTFPEPLK